MQHLFDTVHQWITRFIIGNRFLGIRNPVCLSDKNGMAVLTPHFAPHE